MQATRKKIIKQQTVYIPTHDMARAQAFYANIFQFDLSAYHTIEDPNGEKWSIFPMEDVDADGKRVPTGFFFIGLGYSRHLIPCDKGTIPFLPCVDMEATLERVEAHGGTILQPATLERAVNTSDDTHIAIYYAFFLDTEGNKIGLTHGRVTTTSLSSNP